jgi:PTH1 family peptidyl-tRNA hydrolase
VKVVLGLGNPGPRYAGSRHNAGCDVVALLAEREHIRLAKERFGVLYGEGQAGGVPVVLGRPLTFMNLSGEAVAPFLRYRSVDPEIDLAVVHDDIDLPCGRIKLKYGGGHGGHNGLRSLFAHLGESRFARMRIGVGRPEGLAEGVSDHVLSRPSPEERSLLQEAYERAAEALLVWLREGSEAAMNRYNRSTPEDGSREGPGARRTPTDGAGQGDEEDAG